MAKSPKHSPIKGQDVIEALDLMIADGIKSVTLSDLVNLIRRSDSEFVAVYCAPSKKVIGAGFVYCPLVSKVGFISDIFVDKKYRGGDAEFQILTLLLGLVKDRQPHIESVAIVVDVNKNSNWQSLFKAVESLREQSVFKVVIDETSSYRIDLK